MNVFIALERTNFLFLFAKTEYLNNPETVTSTVELDHNKTNTLNCRPSEFCYQPGQRLISLRLSEESRIFANH